MKVSLIVAMDLERGIGKDNDLMWHLPADMKFFKETTSHQIVVMGRKNFESIPERFRPLPNRENVILTRKNDFSADNCTIFNNWEDCIHSFQEEEKTVYIIGGGEIYSLAVASGIVDEMIITHVNKTYGADTFFPEFDLKNWNVETVFSHPSDERHEASFTTLKYTKK